MDKVWLVVRKNLFVPNLEQVIAAFEDEIDALRQSSKEPMLMVREITVIRKVNHDA